MKTISGGESNCRACGGLWRVTKSNHRFVKHPGDSDFEACSGSGKTRSEVDDMLRTFECWENTKEVTRRTQVVDNGDSVQIVNVLSVSGDVVVELAIRITSVDVVRMRDELTAIIAQREWER